MPVLRLSKPHERPYGALGFATHLPPFLRLVAPRVRVFAAIKTAPVRERAGVRGGVAPVSVGLLASQSIERTGKLAFPRTAAINRPILQLYHTVG